MDLTQLANLGEFIGGVAVLVTLMYLVVQVRQSNANTRAASRQTLIDTMYDASFEVGRDEGICQIMGEGVFDFEALTDLEKSRFSLMMMRFVGNEQNGLLLESQGMLDRVTLDGIAGYLAMIVRSEGGAAWWASMLVPSDVRVYLDDLLERMGDDLPSYEQVAPYFVKRWAL